MTQREVADLFEQTASNISHYENGKQQLPSNCARLLIQHVAQRGVTITFDDVYGSLNPHQEAAPEPHPAAPVRALACASQSVRLTADRCDADRRELARRAEPVDAPQPGQLPLALAGGEPRQEAA